jgi:hypothetical protein
MSTIGWLWILAKVGNIQSAAGIAAVICTAAHENRIVDLHVAERIVQ